MRYQITKPEHGSEKWLAVRWADENGLTRISASVASAIHNENKYTSAADLAMELLADTPPTPQPTNSAMDRGNYMEPVLIKWTADVEGINLITPDVMYCYNEHGARLIATLDAIDDNGIPYEVKTTNKKFTGVLPREWHWQGVQQAICAGSETIEWIIFDNEMQIKRYTQNISSDDREYHIFKCQEFLADIDNGAVPAAAKLEYKHVESMYPESTSSPRCQNCGSARSSPSAATSSAGGRLPPELSSSWYWATNASPRSRHSPNRASVRSFPKAYA